MNTRAGFSLVEILIVILIIGILLAVGLYGYSNYLKRVRLQEVSSRIMQDIERIRSLSIKESYNMYMKFDDLDGLYAKSYTLYKDDGSGTDKKISKYSIPYGLKVALFEPSATLAPDKITFVAPYGEVIDTTNGNSLKVKGTSNLEQNIYVVGTTGMVFSNR